MAQAHIMIVDDVESNRVFIKQLLQNDYRVSEAESGAACLAALEHEHPDLFLLDISMPDMDGYELCTQLRLNESTNTTPIIFVSAINSVDERLAAYEVGGDDFVIKPIEPQDLFSKIKYRLERHGQVARDREQAEAAMLDAVDAVSSEEETLRLADFVKSLQTTKTVQGVGTHICKAIESFGLGGCAVIFGAENHYIQCQADSLEARVLKTAKGSKEHVISIGVRTIICSDYVALLIKDMPIEDSSRYDRFIDHL
ncbi:MAG: response regulator, partial [Oleiphilaceae bacterium]|nr:response regulator [Oleiphilaceae bacterium]